MKRILFFLLALILVTSVGCTKKESPEESFKAYLKSWEERKFEEMYDHLTQASKKEITKVKFVERYEKIYQGIKAANVTVRARSSKEESNDKIRSLYYDVKMDTSAGPIEFTHSATLKKEKSDTKQKWFVEWEPSLIFPQLEKGDTVGVETLKAIRGEIRDRNGSGMAINAPAYVVGIIPEKLGNQSVESLANLIGISKDDINQKLNATWVKPDLFVPILTLPYGEKDLQPYLDITGVMIQEKNIRTYPFGPAAAHLIGYVREINAEQLEELKGKGYSSGDMIGNTGLESIFEEQLRGKDGVHIFIKNENGSLKETLAKTEVVDGETLHLTIDANLQHDIYQQLAEDGGASVALEPKTGAMLALVSTPAYDPNAFVRGLSVKQWEEWSNDPKNPFFNRFTNRNAPGSVFKTITAAAGLNAGSTNPSETKQIKGVRWSKDESWGGYYVTRVKERGTVNLRDALVYSDNIYFAQEALEMGDDTFVHEAMAFGFGEEIPFPIAITPSQLANDGIHSEIQLADSAYGQGEVLMSPVHLALTYTPLLNNGDMLYPYLVRDGDRNVWKKGLLKEETAQLLNEYLLKVVEEGTGRGTYIPGKKIAGKSGTAEIKASKNDSKGTENGWFIGYDLEQQDFLIAMMVEDVKNRGGSSYVVKKVKNIFQLLER